MKYTMEKSLRDFPFWSGAVDRVQVLTDDQLSQIENLMEESCDEWDETSINDFFWFEEDTIAEWLGFSDFEELEKANKGELPTDDEKDDFIECIRRRIAMNEEGKKDCYFGDEVDEESLEGLEEENSKLYDLLEDEDTFAEALQMYHDKMQDEEPDAYRDVADDVIWNYI